MKKWLEDNGFEILNYYEHPHINQCVIDFIDPKVKEEAINQKSAVGWYASAIVCENDTGMCYGTLNRVHSTKWAGCGDLAEFYVPPNMCEREGECRIHVDFDLKTVNPDERLGRVGFEFPSIGKEKVKKFISSFVRCWS